MPTPRGADVAVLSHAFWQSEFGGRDVRGKLFQVGNVRATIISLLRTVQRRERRQPPALYIPITTLAGSTGTGDAKTYFTRYQWGWMHIMVRRKPGVTLEQAEADAGQAFRRSWRRRAPTIRGTRCWRAPSRTWRCRRSDPAPGRIPPRGAHRTLGDRRCRNRPARRLRERRQPLSRVRCVGSASPRSALRSA